MRGSVSSVRDGVQPADAYRQTRDVSKASDQLSTVPVWTHVGIMLTCSASADVLTPFAAGIHGARMSSGTRQSSSSRPFFSHMLRLPRRGGGLLECGGMVWQGSDVGSSLAQMPAVVLKQNTKHRPQVK